MTRQQDILSGLKDQNEPAEYDGQRGFWVQGDCAFLSTNRPEDAIEQNRRRMSGAEIGISHNHFCGSIGALRMDREHARLIAERDAARAQASSAERRMNATEREVRKLLRARREKR